MRAQVARVLAAWVRVHRVVVGVLLTPGRRATGAVGLLACVAVDLLVLLVVAGIVGVLIAPLLGL